MGVIHVTGSSRALWNIPAHRWGRRDAIEQLWHARAEQTRALAQQIDDPQARANLLRIAADYEQLANHAEELNRLTPTGV